MKKLSLQDFNQLLENSKHIKPRLKREIKFNNSIQCFSDEDWLLFEIIPIYDKSGNNGILLVSFDDMNYYLLPFEIRTNITDMNGKTKPIICDFCWTWRNGSEAGSITFPKNKKSLHTIGYLCCGDLKCSLNSRNKTKAWVISKTQIREDIAVEKKIERLRIKIRDIINELEIEKTIQ